MMVIAKAKDMISDYHERQKINAMLSSEKVISGTEKEPKSEESSSEDTTAERIAKKYSPHINLKDF